VVVIVVGVGGGHLPVQAVGYDLLEGEVMVMVLLLLLLLLLLLPLLEVLLVFFPSFFCFVFFPKAVGEDVLEEAVGVVY